MKLSLYEQETILLYNQAEDTAEVYTHDRKLMEKLTRLSKKHPEQVCKKDKHNFTVPKRCVSVREPYSAERRNPWYRPSRKSYPYRQCPRPDAAASGGGKGPAG